MPREKKSAPSDTIFQFKITLAHIKPPIWRRTQIPDGTLEDLHEYIQAVFGWENCHLHQFMIEKRNYAPKRYDLEFGEFRVEDSGRASLSKLLAARRKGFNFRYVYEFGDDWLHEIAYEGTVAVDPNVKYPVCVDGARACPLEDCGGPYGYCNLLDVIANPKHPEHEDLMEWAGEFDPESFDAKQATKAMDQICIR